MNTVENNTYIQYVESNSLWHTPPISSTDYGEEGWQAYDLNYYYLYTNNLWRRTPITTYQNF